jgi:putative transposase
VTKPSTLTSCSGKAENEVTACTPRLTSAASDHRDRLKWDAKFPTIAKSWRSNWARVIPFFAHPPEIRKVIYTTNAIESLNMSLRKVTKARGSFPNDEAVFKLLYLALRNIAKKWTMSVHDWKAALNRFAIVYENRLPVE